MNYIVMPTHSGHNQEPVNFNSVFFMLSDMSFQTNHCHSVTAHWMTCKNTMAKWIVNGRL